MTQERFLEIESQVYATTTHQNLNIRISESGFDYTCGVGTRIYCVESADEHNVEFGSQHFTTLISKADIASEVREACLASVLHQLCHVIGLKHQRADIFEMEAKLVESCYLAALYEMVSGRAQPPATASLSKIAKLIAHHNVLGAS